MIRCIAALSALFWLGAHHAAAANLTLEKADYVNFSGWQEENFEQFFDAFEASCWRLNFKQGEDWLHPSKLGGKVRQWQTVCATSGTVKSKDSKSKKRFFEQFFTPYLVKENGKETGLFTGYFEASLQGSRTQSEDYPYPVYQVPAGVVLDENFFTREEIDAGALKGKGFELLWVKDDVKLFFAHVQGSATVQMDDGTVTRIGFAAKTTHPYRAIGAYLRERGYLEKDNINAETIQAWLYMNANKRQQVFAYNPSYIFFRELERAGGPIGGQGVALTAQRSLAVDKSLIPYGVPIWLETTHTKDNTAYARLMVSQDTGSAIKGAIRGDIFFGYGDEAEQSASYQNSEGRWFLLLPNEQ